MRVISLRHVVDFAASVRAAFCFHIHLEWMVLIFVINLVASPISYIIHFVVFLCLRVEITGPRIRARYVTIDIGTASNMFI